MKRFCSQLIFCAPDKILRQAVIEQNQKNVITNIINLNEQCFETSHTLFLDGIISNEIISLKEHLNIFNLQQIKETYHYIDLSMIIPSSKILKSNNKPLVIDFGTSSLEEINRLLKYSFFFLYKYSVFEIIAACVYYPLLITLQQAKIKTGNKINLHLWKGISLPTHRITEKIKIENISHSI